MEDLFGKEFWSEVEIRVRNGQRKGQAIFNVADIFHPEKTSQLHGSLYDPFYDDRKISEFLTRLADLLTR